MILGRNWPVKSPTRTSAIGLPCITPVSSRPFTNEDMELRVIPEVALVLLGGLDGRLAGVISYNPTWRRDSSRDNRCE
jgi:hypothetical protein